VVLSDRAPCLIGNLLHSSHHNNRTHFLDLAPLRSGQVGVGRGQAGMAVWDADGAASPSPGGRTANRG
jgi:hypothetical protein